LDEFACSNLYYADLYQHTLDQNDKPFISKYILTISMEALPFAMALVDLPLTSNSTKGSHKFTGTDGRGLKITAASNMILLVKEIALSSEIEESDIIIKHRYFDFESQRQVTDFKVNKPYRCQIIVCNLSDEQYTGSTAALLMA
jgi:hypothetical protein